MRLYPPAFLIARAAVGPDVVAGLPVRKRDVILISPWLLHRHEKLWQDPDVFMTREEFANLLNDFTHSAESGDGARFAQHFAEDGIYYDYIYGPHQGRADIADMMQNLFHRDATDYRWEMFDPVFDGTMGYAWSLSSFVSTIPQFKGQRVVIDGMLLGLLVTGDGAETDRLGQPRRGCLRIDLRLRNGRHLQLARAVAEDVEGEHAGENNDRGDQREEDVADDPDKASHAALSPHGEERVFARLEP